MRAVLVIIGILIVLGAAGTAAWYFFFRDAGSVSAVPAQTTEAPYVFDDAGIYFTYPRSYTFESYPLQDDTTSWVSLMLVRTKDKQDADANGASEGPVAITVAIFPNDSSQSLEDWVRNDPHSNFSLSDDQVLTPATVGGQPALSFTHGGVFETDATAVEHGSSIYLFEGEWADAGDSIRTDFQNLLKTVTFK